tara:strand:- start:7141 stop:8283 length:1143 start_codon:yes stop_codon:yes gene_type:complete
MKRKICVTTGTRAEYGLLRPILNEIKKSPNLELILIVTGMHLSKKHGNTIDIIKKDGFKISSKFEMIPKKDDPYDMATTLGHGIINFSKIFKKMKPDINLILGDRDEVFASAIAASHMNIPNAHIHGGDKTKGNIDEYIRHAITKLSNIHFAVSQKSMKRIIQMGENPSHVFFTGSPGIDEIKDGKISSKNTLEKKYGIKFTGNEILLLQHPVTSQHNESEKQIISTLTAISNLNHYTIAIYPNSDAGNNKIFKQLQKFSNDFSFIHLFPSISREDYLGMLKNCGVLVGNSSSGMIECSYLDTHVVNIGIRQEGREHGKNVIHVKKFVSSKIESAIKKSLNSKSKQISRIYGNGNSSKKIVKVLENISLNKKLLQKQISY